MDINIACSHARSWYLFEESLRTQFRKCRFSTWPCKRRFGSFAAGSCFPLENTVTAPELGYAADRGPTGLYYLVTRAESPYCGLALRAAVKVADSEIRPRGLFTLMLMNNGTKTIFKIICELVHFDD